MKYGYFTVLALALLAVPAFGQSNPRIPNEPIAPTSMNECQEYADAISKEISKIMKVWTDCMLNPPRGGSCRPLSRQMDQLQATREEARERCMAKVRAHQSIAGSLYRDSGDTDRSDTRQFASRITSKLTDLGAGIFADSFGGQIASRVFQDSMNRIGIVHDNVLRLTEELGDQLSNDFDVTSNPNMSALQTKVRVKVRQAQTRHTYSGAPNLSSFITVSNEFDSLVEKGATMYRSDPVLAGAYFLAADGLSNFHCTICTDLAREIQP